MEETDNVDDKKSDDPEKIKPKKDNAKDNSDEKNDNADMKDANANEDEWNIVIGTLSV